MRRKRLALQCRERLMGKLVPLVIEIMMDNPARYGAMRVIPL